MRIHEQSERKKKKKRTGAAPKYRRRLHEIRNLDKYTEEDLR